MNKYISELDTNRFGFQVAKINEFIEFTGGPFEAVEKFRSDGVLLIISRVATDDAALINQMESAGFRLKDVQVTYSYRIRNNAIPEAKNSSYVCRGFNENDINRIVEIASQSFSSYGHYSKNNNISNASTHLIYEDWARRGCIDRNIADHIIVAEIEGVLAGFLSLKIKRENNSKFVAGVMGAVDNRFRKGGVFHDINVASLHWAKRESILRVENNVLVTNYPVNGVYISLGFKTIRSESTFHCWLG